MVMLVRLGLSMLVTCVVGCSLQNGSDVGPVARSGEYRVSVSKEGRALSNFEQELVHRVQVTQREIDAVLSKWPAQLNFPFSGVVVPSGASGVLGLRVVFDVSHTAGGFTWGLASGDLITAVGTVPVVKMNDLIKLVSELRSNRRASLTVQRDGVPHKVLYYLVHGG